MESIVIHFLQRLKPAPLLAAFIVIVAMGWCPFLAWSAAWIAEHRFKAALFERSLAELERGGVADHRSSITLDSLHAGAPEIPKKPRRELSGL